MKHTYSICVIRGNPWTRRRLGGKALRSELRDKVTQPGDPKKRPSPLELINASNAGRQPDPIPLRMGRIAESPFGFLRNSAVVMTWDLAHTPTSGLEVVTG